ncbi:uncharacterized protein [Arachis hypogaea]|uniref:uncharacterized protein n=1 Tax=Arachis hypogaea TaxID=3818 RepID=UPI003B21398A
MNTLAPQQDSSKSKRLRLNPEQMKICHLVRDPEIRPMIWKFHPSKRDKICQAYLKAGPNQPILDKYPFSSDTSHRRRFQASWFELYPSWLEYFIEDDVVYCLPCYLFAMESSIYTGSNAFIENGFRNWKKVALIEAMMKARVRIIEKEILHVLATMVRNSIRKDIRDAKFCIIIDEACDESKKEQMAIVLRFVDVDGFVRERFFDFVHLALVAASREVLQIHEFFTQLTAIVNIVGTSCKRHDQLQEAQEIKNAKLIANDELETGQGANQMGTLQRAGDTRWSSHFHSVCSLIRMFTVTHTILNNITDDGTTSAQRGEAYGVNKVLSSFEFIFSLHLMKEIMGITKILCQALQQKSQDILNAMHVVSTSKLLLQKLRDNGWCNLLEIVKKFCEKHEIDIPDMSTQYTVRRGRSR